MDNIEQLKQDNEKLTERLNNAAKFFREQKAQIETLTKEKEELEKKYKEQETFENSTINKVVPELEEKIEALKIEKEEVLKKYTERKNQQAELLGKIEQLEHDAESFNAIQQNYEKEIEKLKKDNASQEEEIERQKIDYETLKSSAEKLGTAYKEAKAELEKNNNNAAKIDELTNKIHELVEAKEKFTAYKNETQNKLKENIAKIAELEKSLESRVQEVRAVEKTTDEIIKKKDASIQELNEKLEKLNKLYTELENEKLSFENDYMNVKSKCEILEIDKANDENVIMGLQEEIRKLEKTSMKKDDALKVIMNLRDNVNFNFESVLDRMNGGDGKAKAQGSVKSEGMTSKPAPVKQFQYTSKDNTIKM